MDAEIFKREFLPYYQKLYRIAFRYVSGEDIAEDIVQDTYLKLWNKRHEMISIENKEAFAVAVLRNNCLDFLKKAKQDYLPLYGCEIQESISLGHEIEIRDNVMHMKILIEKLPEQQKQIIMLKHWDGYSDEEIEQITGLSSGNIRVVLSRARKALREQFVKIEQI